MTTDDIIERLRQAIAHRDARSRFVRVPVADVVHLINWYELTRDLRGREDDTAE